MPDLVRLTWGELKELIEEVYGLADETPIRYLPEDDALTRVKGTNPRSNAMARLVAGELVVD